MSYLEKINIYVSKEIEEQIINDAKLFEIMKKDGYTINNNRFLNMLLKSYYSQYMEEFQNYQNKIAKELEEAGLKKNADYVVNRIIKNIVLPQVVPKKSKSNVKLSLKPVKETEFIVNRIMNSLGIDDYISQYFGRMIASYCSKSFSDREKIIFKDNYSIIEKACEKNLSISFTTIWNSEVFHEVKPYKLAVGKEEFFNYLVCVEKSEFTGEFEARAYRLNRIKDIVFSDNNIPISEKIKKYLDKMIILGPQFAINSEEEIIVRLSKKGIINFNRIYNGRPRYEKRELNEKETLLYFNCSIDQVFFYFMKFSAEDAEIISPQILRERMYKFHKKSSDLYEKSVNLNTFI